MSFEFFDEVCENDFVQFALLYPRVFAVGKYWMVIRPDSQTRISGFMKNLKSGYSAGYPVGAIQPDYLAR